jgi:hypothetical protein
LYRRTQLPRLARFVAQLRQLLQMRV